MPNKKTYYDLLGVSPGATSEEIEKAWRDWKRDPANHPDTHPDPRDKERAEHEFQVRSEAYFVLSRPDERQKYDEELARAEGPIPPTAEAAAAASAEAADWGDSKGGPAGGRTRQGTAKPVKSYGSPSPKPWKRYLRIAPMVIVAAAIIVIWIIYIVVQPKPSLPSAGTTAPGGNSSIPDLVPSTTPTPTPSATPSPTPSATPTPAPCPGGAPTVSINQSDTTTQMESNGEVQYTVTGTISNLTSDAVQIGDIGFYVGNANTNSQPTWQDVLSNMDITPSSSNPDVVDAGDTVTFVDTYEIPAGEATSKTVSATLDYPNTDDQMQSNWTWVDLPSGCQQND